MKLCNLFGKSLRSVNNHLYKEGHDVNMWIDYSQFKKLTKIYPHKNMCRTEPGITLDELNTQLKPYGMYVPYVIPELGD
jgi:FAD/FMN-containing dehydrogenase